MEYNDTLELLPETLATDEILKIYFRTSSGKTDGDISGTWFPDGRAYAMTGMKYFAFAIMLLENSF